MAYEDRDMDMSYFNWDWRHRVLPVSWDTSETLRISKIAASGIVLIGKELFDCQTTVVFVLKSQELEVWQWGFQFMSVNLLNVFKK